jgi:hypothetical protein
MINKVTIICFLALIANYSSTKNEIIKERNNLAIKYKNSVNKKEILDLAREKFTLLLTSKIIEEWKGTSWTFEGHTETPKTGSIACGYFVSTTLRDIGLKLNRYKMAQKKPYDEALQLACGTSIETLKNKSKSDLESYFLTKKADGIYFVGLDFHVGYILKQKQQVYFIHSNYIESKGVMQENISESKAIISHVYHIANLTHNDVLIKNWLTKTKF